MLELGRRAADLAPGSRGNRARRKTMSELTLMRAGQGLGLESVLHECVRKYQSAGKRRRPCLVFGIAADRLKNPDQTARAGISSRATDLESHKGGREI
jgi:hypothetical protein